MPMLTDAQVEAIVSRAALLALHQNDRLVVFAAQTEPQHAYLFYAQSSEIAISNQISRLLLTYAYQKHLMNEPHEETPI